MKKLIKIISVIFILVAALFLLHFILTLNGVDRWLTDRFGKEDTDAVSLIYTEWEHAEYGPEETDLPCIFAREDRLYLTAGENTADITPEGINISYYGGFMDFNETIRSQRNCIVSEDGRYIIYRLEFNEIPFLYYFDTETQKAFSVSDRVDSFDILENDGTEALTLIYATGYTQANKLFLYQSDPTGETAGAATLIAENNQVSGVFEAYGCIVSLDHTGNLYRYIPGDEAPQLLSGDVEAVYFPGETLYNYDSYYKNFTVCCRKNGRDCILDGSAEAPVGGAYREVLPKYTFTGASGETYYYSVRNKRIIHVENGRETVLYETLGDIYHVFSYESGVFVAASADALYLLQEDGSAASELMALPLRYRKHMDLLENHMRITQGSQNLYYVSLLTSGSMVFNPKRAESWMNGANSYNYGLVAVRKDGSGYTAESLPLPPSRRLTGPIALSAGKMTYISYFADGSIKSVSLLDKEGTTLCADILGTSAYAQGQCVLEVFPCVDGTYFRREREPGRSELFLLTGEAVQLEPAGAGNGIFPENSSDFRVSVSFGQLVIF